MEAGPNAMGDLVFMPHKFENLKEALVAFNEAGKHMPDESTRSDAFSRMTFPRTMPNAQEEEKYNLFKGTKIFTHFVMPIILSYCISSECQTNISYCR